MASRRKAREHALQILYLVDLSGTPTQEAIELFQAHFDSQEGDLQFAKELVSGIHLNLAKIDQCLEHHSEHWRLSRMPRVDRNILRLGIYELMFCEHTPGPVIVDEAVELAKRFGDQKSGAFVNGILDRVLQSCRNKQ